MPKIFPIYPKTPETTVPTIPKTMLAHPM